MDFSNWVGQAGTFLTRAVQMTEEIVYSGEKTTIDPQLEAKYQAADLAKNWTQRIVKDTETLLTPNPGYRIEDMLMEKIDKKRPTRLSTMETLGSGLVEAGNDFGAGSAYGSMLIKVGQNELKLGQAEREFITQANKSFIEPLNRFIENEVKNCSKERKNLENKRLDLDAAKNRLRKARSMSNQSTTDHNNGSAGSTDPKVTIYQAERDVIDAQKEFTQQQEQVKIQVEILMAARDRHIENLRSLIIAQTAYYQRCNQLMFELNKDLETMPLQSVNLSQSFSIDSQDNDREYNVHGPRIQMKGKVMYDYIAKTQDEMTLYANEIINVEESSDHEFYQGSKGTDRGRVPKSCILIIDN